MDKSQRRGRERHHQVMMMLVLLLSLVLPLPLLVLVLVLLLLLLTTPYATTSKLSGEEMNLDDEGMMGVGLYLILDPTMPTDELKDLIEEVKNILWITAVDGFLTSSLLLILQKLQAGQSGLTILVLVEATKDAQTRAAARLQEHGRRGRRSLQEVGESMRLSCESIVYSALCIYSRCGRCNQRGHGEGNRQCELGACGYCHLPVRGTSRSHGANAYSGADERADRETATCVCAACPSCGARPDAQCAETCSETEQSRAARRASLTARCSRRSAGGGGGGGGGAAGGTSVLDEQYDKFE